MRDAPDTKPIFHVIRDEYEKLETRREQMGLAPPQAPPEIASGHADLRPPTASNASSDVVGLAISGGGLRSACFGLGVIQALFQSGLWRFVDYLSTVSGGGFIGSYLTSYVVRNRERIDRDNCPILPREGDGKQPPDVQRFIYGGRFLFDAWELLNKYLIGLFFINVALFSLLVAGAAIVALLWRCLDLEGFRDHVFLFKTPSDLITPFWPFLIFFVCWSSAWVVSYWRRGAEAPGKYARYFLLLMTASVLVGLALLHGNGDVSFGAWLGAEYTNPWRPGNSLFATITGLTIGGLLPFLAPRRLIQSGMKRNKQWWEKVIFGIATTAALVGVPLLIIGYLGKENISGYHDHPSRELSFADIRSTPNGYENLISILWPPETEASEIKIFALPLVASVSAATEPSSPPRTITSDVVDETSPRVQDTRPPTTADQFIRDRYFRVAENSGGVLSHLAQDQQQQAVHQAMDFRAKLREAMADDDFTVNEQSPWRFSDYVANRGEFLTDHGESDLSAVDLLLSNEVTKHKFSARDDLRIPARWKLLIAIREVHDAYNTRKNRFHGLDQYETMWDSIHRTLRNNIVIASHMLSIHDGDNEARHLHDLRVLQRRLQQELTEILNLDVLCHPETVATYVAAVDSTNGNPLSPPAASEVTVSTAERGPNESDSTRSDHETASLSLAQHLLNMPKPAAADESTVTASQDPKQAALKKRTALLQTYEQEAATQNIARWSPEKLFEFNVLLLESRYRDIFQPRSVVQRRTVIGHDQVARLGWLAGALLVFLFVGMWVDANATSMHRYYRTRLVKAFIVPHRNKVESPALSEMITTDFGAPYHILSASTGLLLDSSGNEHVPAGQAFATGQEPEYRSVDSFMFSQCYCGSQLTGYVPTEQYEGWIRGENNRMDLAEATAISGAAVSPGQVSNRLVAVLMLALNLRLGQWIPNPARGAPRTRPNVLALLMSLRQKARDRQYCFVTDGGNSENLGLVQLLRRRCRLIIQIDAGHDPCHEFADLGRAIRTARIHGGVRLVSLNGNNEDFSTTSLNLAHDSEAWLSEVKAVASLGRCCNSHFFLAKIIYRDQTEGLLVYVKPSFTGTESADLQQYRREHPEFPHQPTSDQFYDRDQVESYRHLGYRIGAALVSALPPTRDLWTDKSINTETICQWFTEAADRLHNLRTPITAAPDCGPDPDSGPDSESAPTPDTTAAHDASIKASQVMTQLVAASQSLQGNPWHQGTDGPPPTDTGSSRPKPK